MSSALPPCALNCADMRLAWVACLMIPLCACSATQRVAALAKAPTPITNPKRVTSEEEYALVRSEYDALSAHDLSRSKRRERLTAWLTGQLQKALAGGHLED